MQPQSMRLADRGYDADWIRALVNQQGAWTNIPPKRDRKEPKPCPLALDYYDPHLIVARPATAPLNPAQNLYSHQPTLRLALKPHASSETCH
jgi:hypothetical protein